MLRPRVSRAAAVLGLFLTPSCASLSGLEGGSSGDGGADAASDASGDATGADAITFDGALPEASVDGDGGADAGPTCAADASFGDDMHNCGRCGHDCQGGPCMGGTCQPVTLFSNLDYVHTLAVDDTNLYWQATTLSLGGVYFGPKSGGAPVLVSQTSTASSGLALDDTSVYWTTASSIVSCPKSMGACATPNVLASAQAYGIVVDTSHLYFTENAAPGGLFEVPKGGGGTQALAAADNSASLAMGAGRLFWSAGGALSQYDLATTTVTMLAPGPGVGQIAANDVSVYWFNSTASALFGCTEGACDAGFVASGTVWALAADATSVYWALQSGTLWAYTPSSGPTMLATVGGVMAIAVDASAVYYATAANGISTILRVAKP